MQQDDLPRNDAALIICKAGLVHREKISGDHRRELTKMKIEIEIEIEIIMSRCIHLVSID
ncbi:hypothetical protein CK911_07710 [Aeromonas sp. CU5]|nr:hypothetical protein CK911_07710 [Aeromonas sp. CU5]